MMSSAGPASSRRPGERGACDPERGETDGALGADRDPAMTPNELSGDELRAVATHAADAITDWTYPRIRGAVHAALAATTPRRFALPHVVADRVATDALALSPDRPDNVAAFIGEALQPWRRPDPPPPPPDTRLRLQPAEPQPPTGMRHGLPPIAGYEELAFWLNLTVGELDWLADRGRWLKHARYPLQHYRITRREKRGGHRIIEAPKPLLRETQRRLLRRVVEHIPAHPAARGFVRGSSTAAFAWPHADRAAVVRVDLRHCFESIGISAVRAVFTSAGYPPHIARVLADLCTTTTPADQLHGIDWEHRDLLRRSHLPQGAPTSPHLANLVLRRLDRRIDGYAKRNDLQYTRYGDDIAVSGDSIDAHKTLRVVLAIVEDCGFTAHPGKVRIMYAHQQQRLAGLVVNDRPQVSRADYDALRALLHNAVHHGPDSQNHHGHPDFRAHVHGLISWVGATNPTRRRRLLDLAAQIDWNTEQ